MVVYSNTHADFMVWMKERNIGIGYPNHETQQRALS